MCGVVGTAIRPSRQNVLNGCHHKAAMEILDHRGPDAHGQHQDESVWFAHTRLSILDLSSAGSQPMQTTDDRFIITYNGEVYNFKRLAQQHGLGNLRSNSDTEVVLQMFAKLGVDSLISLNGMFAFAIYDTKARMLWLVRDRLGIKPLYYHLDANRLSFASEVKGILALNSKAATCDVAGLHEWLYYGNPLGEKTLYREIKQLLPGHFLELDLNSFESNIRPYWSLKQQASVTDEVSESSENLVAETRHLLEQAVKRQLVSDVPVGVFLSGGIDSSAIVAFASRHYEKKLATYSAGFDFSRNSGELPRAKRIAALYGTDHHEIHIAGGTVSDLITKMVDHHDMPFSDAANIPLYLMASNVGRTSKVILQGDGGDELFGGYSRYSTLNYYSLLHAVARSLQFLEKFEPGSALQYRAQRYIRAFAAEDLAKTFALLLTVENPLSTPAAIFQPEMRHAVERSDPFTRFHDCLEMFVGHDICNQMSLVDLMIVLPDTYLEKVDRATMAASLEVRVPFLDHDLVEFIVRVQGKRKTPWGRRKWLLKKALRGIVPSEVLDGPKIGLEVPYGKWLQGPLKPMFFDYLARFSRSNPGVLDVAHITQLFDRTGSGIQNHSYMLWKILNLIIWAERSKVRFSS